MLYWLKKPGSNAFYSNYGTDIDITKLSVQSSLKCLITEISEKRQINGIGKAMVYKIFLIK